MKFFLLSILASLALLFSSCGGSKGDDLLKSIPKNTRFLALVRPGEIASKPSAGGPVELSGINQALSLLGKEIDPALLPVWEYALSEGSGADFSNPVAAFEFRRATVYTLFLSDAGKFRKGLERKLSVDFTEEDGVATIPGGRVFVLDNQAWVTSDYPGLAPKDIKLLRALKEESSALGMEYAREMLERDDDFSWYVGINGILGDDDAMEKSALLVNILFDDPRYIGGFFNFKDGRLAGEATVLDDKFHPSPMSLKLGILDSAMLDSFHGTGNALAALALDGDRLKALADRLRHAGMLPPFLLPLIEGIDGTAVFSFPLPAPDDFPAGLSATVTFRSAEAAQKCALSLKDLLPDDEGASLTTEGSKLLLSCSGAQVPSVGFPREGLEGASLAIVLYPGDTASSSPAKNVVVALRQADGCAIINFSADSSL